jgi:hypothetical protein
MTTFHLRTEPQQPVTADTNAFLLDWFTGPQRQRSTIAASSDLLFGLQPTPAARDLLRVAAAVYCADKVARRDATRDAWTRDLELELPVANRAAWQRARPALTEALAFLSGDRWKLRFRTSGERPARTETRVARPDAVCLFSGGLDSLTGAIDLLEQGQQLILVGHFDSGYIGGVQDTLCTQLRRVHRERVRIRKLRLSPAKPNRLQARPLPDGEERERTTRARSFLFIAAGLAVASAFDDTVSLHMPENGFIGINVPFVASRAGSNSTRTTHPYFLEQLGLALAELDIRSPIVNLYRLQTKGELLAGCRNPQLLAALADRSVSCAHPESGRYEKQPPGNCGSCFPCLIRRAALHHIGLDSPASYRRDALSDAELRSGETDRGADLRAVLRGLAREPRAEDVFRNGAVPATDALAFADVHRRGRAELAAWLESGGRRRRGRTTQGRSG